MAENVSEMIINENSMQLASFWPKVTEEIRGLTVHDVRTQELPLARIKRIMKLDEEVKMISAEAPALFSKAAEMFITELTLRAWIHTEDNKRRTLQKNDIAMAITKYDQFDFLIDIVPREEIKPAKREEGTRTAVPTDQHYFQIAQHYQNVLTQGSSAPSTNTTTSPPQQAIQIVQTGQQASQASGVTNQVTHTEQQQQPTQIIQLPQQPQQQQTQQQQNTQQQGGIQIIQQIVGADGQIQQIPIPLTPQQVQMIRLQMSGASTQPIIIQTPLQAVNQQNNQSTASSQPQILQLQSIT